MSALQATIITGACTVLEEGKLKEFQARLRGELLRPGDDGYDDARKVWNGMIDRRMPSPLSSIPIADFHGAYRRVGKTDTAYYHRDLRYDIVIGANWTDPADTERNVQWARELYEALQAHLPHGVYVNDLDRDEGDE